MVLHAPTDQKVVSPQQIDRRARRTCATGSVLAPEGSRLLPSSGRRPAASVRSGSPTTQRGQGMDGLGEKGGRGVRVLAGDSAGASYLFTPAARPDLHGQ
ncbi:hypothetical protein GCM10022206_50330 [Streptomyces chiangmaiensis]